MKFGFFDDAKKEYVITTPKTPYPWINYLGIKDFLSLISNHAGGYCFYKDARLRRITRFRYNNVPLDAGGRYYYIKDGDCIWSPSWMPTKTDLDYYVCRHGLGYTIIKSEKNKIEVEETFFVPIDEDCEIHNLKITNKSNSKKIITIFSFLEFCLWNAYDDMTNFQRNFSTGEVEIEGSTIYHKTEYRERRNHFSFYSVNHSIDGYDTDRETFLGLYRGFENPIAVERGQSFNSEAHGWAPIASHMIKLELEPNQTENLVFLLGYVENDEDKKWKEKRIINKEKAYRMIEKFSSIGQVNIAFAELHEFWTKLLNKLSIKTHDLRIDRTINIWNQYQCMVTFNLSRSASYFESGIGRGMGFRDSNQDVLGFVHQIPERTRERILDLAATQLEDGGAYHQYQPLTKRGNNESGDNFNDDPLWLILSTAQYIKETGDWSILSEKVPFENDETKMATMFEHLKRSFYHVVNNLGPHGLPLIGRADWNDCLNLNAFSTQPDQSFQTCVNKDGKTAESIMIACMYVFIGKEFLRICEEIGEYQIAKDAKEHIEKMKETIIKYGYDGEWFLRAYDDFGNKVGSKENDEGKIFIETQGWGVMAGIGLEDGKAQKALDSVKEYLDTPHGIVLVQPAFSEYKVHLGEITSYPPGYKENAAVFCHNNPWVIIAECILGRGERAFEYWSKIAPAFREEISDIHKIEPYVYCQMIAGKDAYKPGEAKNSWLTGAAAWNFVAMTQWILGIRPDYDGLIIDPCIPPSWDGFCVKRIFRGTVYNIEVKNPNRVSKGVKKVIIDGNEFSSNIVPPLSPNIEHKIEVIMG